MSFIGTPFTLPGRSDLTGPIAVPVFNPRAIAPAEEPEFARLAMEWGYAGVGITPTGVRPLEGQVVP